MKKILIVLAALPLADVANAAKCKFDIEEADHIETRRVVLFRGATVGLGGKFGVQQGEYYLRGFFGSNFKARASFTAANPLELTLADGRVLSLEVVTEATSSKLQFGHIITSSREAEPVFAVSREQWSALMEHPIVSLHMSYEAKGERKSENRKVKGKHADKIMAALTCLAQASDAESS